MQTFAFLVAGILLCGGAVAQAPTGGSPAVTAEDAATIEKALKADAAWWEALPAEESTRITRLLGAEASRNLNTRGGQVNAARARQVLDVLEQRAPQARERSRLEGQYVRALEESDPKAAVQWLGKLMKDGNTEVAEMAKSRHFVASMTTEPIKFRYMDIDGKMLDMENYRGKVVLIDFWATWCVPCMAEMPNIRAVYDKYRAQGFEVIGVTDDTETTELREGSNRHTVASLKAAMEKAGMNWPQLWDRSDEPGVKPLLRKFAIGVLPTTFLFGKDGRLITKDNKGEKLEQNVRQALGLPPMGAE